MRKLFFIVPLLVLIIFISGCTQQEKPEEEGWIKPAELIQKEAVLHAYGPKSIAITKDSKYAYIGFSLSETVLKINLENFAIESAADLSAYFPIQSYNIALDASEKKLFVHSTSWRKLIVLDTQTMSVIHTIDDIGTTGTSRSMLRSQYGPFLILWGDVHTVKFVNTETYEVTNITDESVMFVQIQESKSNQNQWYVASPIVSQPGGEWKDWKVGIYDYKTKEWKNFVQLEMECVMDLRVLPNEKKVYVGSCGQHYQQAPTHSYGWVYSVDLEKKESKTIPIDGGVLSLEMSPDGKRIYIGAGDPLPRNTNNIQVVDTQTDTVVGSADLSKLPQIGTGFTEVRDVEIDPSNPNFLYAVSPVPNAIIKINLDSLSAVDFLGFLPLIPMEPHFFVRQQGQATGYLLVPGSAEAFEFDVDKAIVKNIVKFPSIRDDPRAYDIAIDNTGKLLIAQGESVLEVDATDMKLIKTNSLLPNFSGLWNFILSKDQTRLYSIWTNERGPPNTFIAINRVNYQVEARVKLEGGGFNSRPYELPDGSKLYILGGYDWGSITVHVIETNNYTIKKTITYEPPAEFGKLGISVGDTHPFAYDSNSHTLFMGAGTVVLAVNTDTDEIRHVIYLRDVAKAIGLQPEQFVYVNAHGLVYQPQENYLYIAHGDRSFASIYDLNNNSFLPKAIPLKGYFPKLAFTNDDCSKIYTVNALSDSISVIDVNSKTIEKVIDLHNYLQ